MIKKFFSSLLAFTMMTLPIFAQENENVLGLVANQQISAYVEDEPQIEPCVFTGPLLFSMTVKYLNGFITSQAKNKVLKPYSSYGIYNHLDGAALVGACYQNSSMEFIQVGNVRVTPNLQSATFTANMSIPNTYYGYIRNQAGINISGSVTFYGLNSGRL